MLSRLAESLFWLGRYVERAEGAARLLEVHVHRLLEDAAADEAADGADLLAVLGVGQPAGGPLDLARTVDVLALDPGSGVGVASSLGAAREAARGAREEVSSELWTSLNTTWVELGDHRGTAHGQVASFCRWVRSRCAELSGLADHTLPRDEGWLLLDVGRCLERADTTARLLSLFYDEADPHVPVALLTAAGAHEAYLRRHRALVSLEGAVDFLMLDRAFPRSVAWCLGQAERSLVALHDRTGPRRAGPQTADPALRALGRVRTRLEYSDSDDVRADLGAWLDEVQEAVRATTAALGEQYFLRGAPSAWAAGAVR